MPKTPNRAPVRALSLSAPEVAAKAAAEKARKAASREALRAQPAVTPATPIAPTELPLDTSHSDRATQDRANALATAKQDAEALGVPIAVMLAEMGLNTDGSAKPEAKARYVGPMLALVAARKHYVKAANGQACNGDALATLLGEYPRDIVIRGLTHALAIASIPCRGYDMLNPGQQSMNLRNKARHAIKEGTLSLDTIRQGVRIALDNPTA